MDQATGAPSYKRHTQTYPANRKHHPALNLIEEVTLCDMYTLQTYVVHELQDASSDGGLTNRPWHDGARVLTYLLSALTTTGHRTTPRRLVTGLRTQITEGSEVSFVLQHDAVKLGHV
eukprot:scaffold931_cov383-Prasinococcus_capsulatus_cf.AAC.30